MCGSTPLFIRSILPSRRINAKELINAAPSAFIAGR